jgi:hypothetical protein
MQKLLQHLDSEYHIGGLLAGLFYLGILVFLVWAWTHGGGTDF